MSCRILATLAASLAGANGAPGSVFVFGYSALQSKRIGWLARTHGAICLMAALIATVCGSMPGTPGMPGIGNPTARPPMRMDETAAAAAAKAKMRCIFIAGTSRVRLGRVYAEVLPSDHEV